MVAIEKSSSKIYLPRLAPTGAAIAAIGECHIGCLGKFGGGQGRDAVSGMKGIHVREVAVFTLRFGVIFAPLLQLAFFSYFIWRQLGKYAFEFLGIFLVLAENLACSYHIAKQVADYGIIHGATFSHSIATTVEQEGIFGRGRGRSDEISVALYQPIAEEVGSEFHHRIGSLGEIFLIAGEGISFPQILAQPATCSIPVSPKRIAVTAVAHGISQAPNVTVLVSYPSTSAIILIGSALAHLREVLYPVEHWLVHLAQVGALGEPIVHLCIDICGVVRAPGCTIFFVPNALQVGCRATRA